MTNLEKRYTNTNRQIKQTEIIRLYKEERVTKNGKMKMIFFFGFHPLLGWPLNENA